MRLGTVLIHALLFINSHELIAQFDALPEANAQWALSFWIGPGYPHEGVYYEFDDVSPDTIYEGEVFKKLIRRHSYGSSIISGSYYGGAIRDNGMGQVYFWQGDIPLLLYDFDVNVGDTVEASRPSIGPELVIVYSIDTIEINGTERKRIGVHDYNQSGGIAYWIQGIGGDGGFDFTCGCGSVSGSGTLSCMTLNGIVEWGGNVGNAGDCELLLNVSERADAEPFLREGPIGVYTIQHPSSSSFSWRVIDANGRLLRRSTGTTIDLRDNRPGFYIIHAELHGEHFTQPLIYVE